jgi:hypothetical protein
MNASMTDTYPAIPRVIPKGTNCGCKPLEEAGALFADHYGCSGVVRIDTGLY